MHSPPRCHPEPAEHGEAPLNAMLLASRGPSPSSRLRMTRRSLQSPSMPFRDIVRERGLWPLTGLVAALFWRPLTFKTFFFRDLYLLIYPKKLFFATAIRSGELPLWDPYTSGGQPYLASPGNFAFHPTNLLYLVLPPIVAFNWIMVLHVAACAVFAYWLARTIQLSQPAAFVTGAVFALSGFALSTLNLMPWLLGLPWIPLTIGLLHRALRDGRSVAPAA